MENSEGIERDFDVIVEPRFYLKFSGIKAKSINEAAKIACEEFFSARTANGELINSIPDLEGRGHFKYCHVDNESDVYEVEVEDCEAETYTRIASFGVSTPLLSEVSGELGVDYALQRYIADNVEKLPVELVREAAMSVARRYGYNEEQMEISVKAFAYIISSCAADGNADGLKITLFNIKQGIVLEEIKERTLTTDEIDVLGKMASMSSLLQKSSDFLYSKDHPDTPYYRYAECIEMLDDHGLVTAMAIKKAIDIASSMPDHNQQMFSALQALALKKASESKNDEKAIYKVSLGRKKPM